MRFLAASSVILGHAYNLNGLPDIIETTSLGLFPTGQIAVYIFFIISGYCILQSKINSKTEWSYLFKRVIRIFPGLAVALLFVVFIVGTICTEESIYQYLTNKDTYRYFKNIKLFPIAPTTLPSVFNHNTHVEVNGSLWTLAYEFIMYIFVIVEAFLFRSRWHLFTITFGAFFISYCIYNDFFSESRTIPFINLSLYHSVNFGIYFILGMLFYIYRDIIVLNRWGAFLAIVIWLGMYPLASIKGYFPLITINWVRYFSLSYLVMYLSSLKGVFNNFGKHGDFSYGIYIYSFPVQQMIVLFWGQYLEIYQQILLAYLMVLPLSWLSWHYVEKPVLKYKYYSKKQPLPVMLHQVHS